MIYWGRLSMGGQRVSPRYVVHAALKGFSMHSSSGLHVTVFACFVPFLSYNSLNRKAQALKEKKLKKNVYSNFKACGSKVVQCIKVFTEWLMTQSHMVKWENWLRNVDFWPHKQTVAYVYILYHRIDKCYFFQKLLMLLWMSCMHMRNVWTCVYLCEPCCVIQCSILLLFSPLSNGMVHSFTIVVITNYHYLSGCL